MKANQPKKILLSLEEYIKKLGKPKKFVPNVWWDKENHLIRIILEDVCCYSDLIKGGDALESIRRSIDDNRIIGATLSYFGEELKFFRK